MVYSITFGYQSIQDLINNYIKNDQHFKLFMVLEINTWKKCAKGTTIYLCWPIFGFHFFIIEFYVVRFHSTCDAVCTGELGVDQMGTFG